MGSSFWTLGKVLLRTIDQFRERGGERAGGRTKWDFQNVEVPTFERGKPYVLI